MTYNSEWWSVELPSHWHGYQDDSCSTFRAEPPLGVLQVSAALKDFAVVTEEDLREFAEERIAQGLRMEQVCLGEFSGFTTSHQKDGSHWHEWWLRSGQLMVYVTYIVDQENAATEGASISGILSSLAKVAD